MTCIIASNSIAHGVQDVVEGRGLPSGWFSGPMRRTENRPHTMGSVVIELILYCFVMYIGRGSVFPNTCSAAKMRLFELAVTFWRPCLRLVQLAGCGYVFEAYSVSPRPGPAWSKPST